MKLDWPAWYPLITGADCGLKTRNWEETRIALANMVAATEALRKTYASQGIKESI